MSKSKTAPKEDIDSLHIPKLELLEYFIASKLNTYVKNVIGLKINHQYLWTGNILFDFVQPNWMKSNKLLPPFVPRRINAIKQNKEIQPYYINIDNNPADVATRSELQVDKNHLCFQGSFLLKEKSERPQICILAVKSRLTWGSI